MMPNTLILVVGEGVINLFSTSLLLYKSRRTPPPKYSHGIIKCRFDPLTPTESDNVDAEPQQKQKDNIDCFRAYGAASKLVIAAVQLVRDRHVTQPLSVSP
ncbi:hypothetical protein PG985_005776 [Apiospora marii]|uniref:uncharacterized protein n=1 Tax=Apiospora marii TaxID=335849 RepID=UPI0031328456